MFDKPIVVNDKQMLYSDEVSVDQSDLGDVRLYFQQPVVGAGDEYGHRVISMIGMSRKAAEKLHEKLGKELGKEK